MLSGQAWSIVEHALANGMIWKQEEDLCHPWLATLTLWTLEIWNRDGLKVLILVVFRKSRPQKLPRSEQNLKTNDTSSAGCRGLEETILYT